MEAILEMMASCMIHIITNSIEAWNPTKMELKNTNKIMENVIARKLMYHQLH